MSDHVMNPSPIEIQHMICMLLLPMVGDDDLPVGVDTRLPDIMDSLDTLELLMGIEEFFPTFDSDKIHMDTFGPTVREAAMDIHEAIKDGP